MFQINWKIKAFLYKVLFFLKVERALFFIQKKITKSANINIDKVNENWKYHLKYLQSFNSITVLEFGAGKSLEQNIFFSYQLNDKLFQTVIDVSNMLDIDLFNQASDQVATILKKNRKAFVQSIDGIKKNYNIEYIAPCDIEKIERSGLKFDAFISTTTLEHLPLSKLKNIKVSSRLDVDPNRIKSASIFQLRKDLGVDYLLRGRIIKIDNQIRISVNLVDTEKETILWSDSYVRKYKISSRRRS